jgi:hypothetical protein
MEDKVAAANTGPKRFRIEQVSGDRGQRRRRGHPGKVREVAGFADKKAKIRSLAGKDAGDVTPDKSGGTCYKDFHSAFSIFAGGGTPLPICTKIVLFQLLRIIVCANSFRIWRLRAKYRILKGLLLTSTVSGQKTLRTNTLLLE